ncbi:MAG TPA: alpha-L-fucosidase [Saprospiraceae bacterium]|nr:alpha-L-fucosidase [Saprospiraceae bacterium]
MDWHETEFYLFVHFGPNTFTDAEWGHGTESEDIFNPTALDCAQWCRIAKAAGAKGIIITAKHHDGFCLWPSKYSTHTVRESPWKGGKGDVLRELAEACRHHGLKLGFYLSPWDRNHPLYGSPEYNEAYVSTMTELMTQYGPLFEFWWDGANGEGPNGRRQVYDFQRFEREAARLQPNAVVFSDIGPGCRWAGNEQGTVQETNWCLLDTAGYARGIGAPPQDTLQRGNFKGKNWIPAECDVSIRPGWFYHAEEDNRVKSSAQLFDIYLRSVGRGANLILNVPPDRRGLFHPKDSAALVQFGEKLRRSFACNLASQQPVFVRAGKRWKKCPTLSDGDRRSAQAVGGRAGAVLELRLSKRQRFNCVRIQEAIEHGQQVCAFQVEVKHQGKWQQVAQSTTIGPRKILMFDAVEADRLRVRIMGAKDVPRLTEVELYLVEP